MASASNLAIMARTLQVASRNRPPGQRSVDDPGGDSGSGLQGSSPENAYVLVEGDSPISPIS